MPTALITGASRGLGAAIARALAPTHDLLLGGRASARLEQTVAQIAATTDHRVEAFAVELTDDAALAAATATIESLDVVVHSAGVGSTLEPVADTPASQWRSILEVNLVAAAELTRLLLPALRTASGHVVFINSGAGQRANPGWAPYAASKFGLRALADALRAEEPGIRVTSIFPGRIDTDMQRELVAIEGRDYDPAQFLTTETVATATVNAIVTGADADPTEIVLRPRQRS